MAKAIEPIEPLRHDGLTWRKRKFVLYYVETGNMSEAFRRAGYSPGNAHKNAFALMGDPDIQRALAAEEAALRQRFNLSLETTLAEMQAIAHASMANYLQVDDAGKVTIDLRGLSPAEWAAIKSYTMTPSGPKIELHDKQAALQAIGRHLGMGLGKARVILEDRRERTKLARILGALSDDEVQSLAQIGQRLEDIAAKTIDGDAVEVEAEPAEGDDDPPDGDGAEEESP